MNTTTAHPTWLKALVGFFVTSVLLIGAGSGTASAQARPYSSPTPAPELCGSLVRGVKDGTWTPASDGVVISKPFRRVLSGTNVIRGLDGRAYWYAVNAKGLWDGRFIAKCSVYFEGEWRDIARVYLDGSIRVNGNAAYVDIDLPLTAEQQDHRRPGSIEMEAGQRCRHA